MKSESSGASPCAIALDRLRDGVSMMIAAVDDGGLDHLAADEKVAFWQALECERRRLPVVEHALVTDAERHSLAGHFVFRSLVMFLRRSLALSGGESAARVRAAESVGPRITMLGASLPPVRPVIAAAQRAGEVSPEQVDVVVRALDELGSSVSPGRVDAAEELLVDQARVFGPIELAGSVAGWSKRQTRTVPRRTTSCSRSDVISSSVASGTACSASRGG